MYFGHLRKYPWEPTFSWLGTSAEAADQINSFHEDYPKYVEATKLALDGVEARSRILNSQLSAIHRSIFSDQPFTGKWREVNVVVGIHRPPSVKEIGRLMSELENLYVISYLDTLIEWYKDFETIHPFQDGNGRVGGVIVAAYSHSLYPDSGWLTVEQ